MLTSPLALTQTNISSSESFNHLWKGQIEKQVLPWLVLIWSIGVVVSSLRLLSAWTYIKRLNNDKKHTLTEPWAEILDRLSQKMRITKPITLLESTLVHVPTVIGWLKPLILIPPSALAGLTPQQLELIIAHEMAHIKRYDYLVNLLQIIVEMLLFYHPAAWWVSGEIRKERENACDDLAISFSGKVEIYASALVKLERLRKTTPSLAVAVDGGGSLTMRIHRLIGVEMPHSKGYAGLWMIAFITFFMVTIGIVKQNSSVIIDHISNELPLNLTSMMPSLTNSELNKGAIQSPSLQVAAEIQHNKKLAEASTEDLLARRQPEMVFNAKPDKKQDTGYEQNGDQNLPVVESEQMSETLQEAPKVIERVNEVVNQNIKEVVNTLTNIKSQEENKYVSQTESQDFIEEMASVGYTNLSLEELIKLKKAGVSAKYVKSLSAVGFSNLTIKDLARMSEEGVTPAYIMEIRNAGFQQITGKELAYFKDLGITAEFINSFRNAGYGNLSMKELFSFRDNRITIDFIKSMNSAGFGKLSPNDLVSLRDSRITPEFVEIARNRFGNNLTLKQMIEFKRNGTLKDNE